MNNSHDEIKSLLEASRKLLNNEIINEDIRRQYGSLSKQGVDMNGDNTTKKFNITQSVEDEIEDNTESLEDKSQGYRISGGVLVLHGKRQTDLELTTDEKVAFQETMDEFIDEVSDLVDFNKLNIFPNNVEWSGKIIDFDIEFFFTIGEENGVYINGQMIKSDDKFLDIINKLKIYYEKFKSKWAKIMALRKKTKKIDEE